MQFSNVVGHQALKDHLLRIASEKKIPHAQLFLSKPGAGGLPMAMAFAQLLVCERPSANDSCGVCPACVKASKLIHPDIHFCYPVIRLKGSTRAPLSSDYAEAWRNAVADNVYLSEYEWIQKLTSENSQGNITREEARHIIQQLNLKAFEGGYKIQIIWMAEHLGEAGNLLLKLIEEPPGNTVLILIAENQEAILPTIISRTQILKLPALSDVDVALALTKDYSIDSALAEEIAYIAQGNFRKAQQLATGELEGFGEDLKNWMVYCMRGPAADLVKWTEKAHSNGREYLKKFFTYSIDIFRETAASRYSNEQLKPHVSASELPVVQALKKYITHDKLYELIPLMEEKAYHIERNGNAKIVLMDLSISMRGILKR
jgi:DNA polymerase III subunit delta'